MPKAGKTAALAACAASSLSGLSPKELTPDFLGFTSDGNPNEYAVLYFDTEQSDVDSYALARRIAQRAGLDALPCWFKVICLTGLGPNEAEEQIVLEARMASLIHGGVHSIFLDGAADLAFDTNDLKESMAGVQILRTMSIALRCPVVCSIHFNPNTDKTRGHLGSEIERKAETNLTLEKNKEGVTTIWSTKQRRAPIPKETGPCFRWDDAREMHVSTSNIKVTKADKKQGDLRALAKLTFGDPPGVMTYGKLLEAIMQVTAFQQRTAEYRIAAMTEAGFIHKNPAGDYTLSTEGQPFDD